MSILTSKTAINETICRVQENNATFLHAIIVPNKYTNNGPTVVETVLDATKTPRIDASLFLRFLNYS